MPQISVIVPVYNVEPYLRRFVDSILNQTYTDFELILVDDGSPDGCPAICDEYKGKDRHVKVIHKVNGGVSSARNAGLDAAQGKYIAFADSDDWVETNWLEKCYSAIDEINADIISYGFKLTSDPKTFDQDHNTDSVPVVSYIDNSEKLYSSVLLKAQFRNGYWSVWSALFKRNIIESNSIRFCTSCHDFAEDMAFYLIYLMHVHTAVSLKDRLYIYDDRRNESMMNTSKGICRVDDLNEVSKNVEAHFHKVFAGTKEVSEFGRIHHYIVLNQLYGLYQLYGFHCMKEIGYWKNQIDKIADIAYFLNYNQSYYHLFRANNKYHMPVRLFIREDPVNRFLSNLNTTEFKLSYFLWNTLEIPFRVLRKLRSVSRGRCQGGRVKVSRGRVP